MLETVLYADLGSAVTKLAARGRIICQESRAVLDDKNEGCVLAVGDNSRRILNASPAYPIRNGAVANPALAAVMLRRFALDMMGRRSLCGVSLRLLLPGCATQMQKLAAGQAAETAGFRRTKTLDQLICGAVGAGVDIEDPSAVMVADLGRDKLAAAVCANGGSICQSLHKIGSADFERTLRAHFAAEHGLLVGARNAELIKQSMHLPFVSVNGRSAETGLSASITVKSSELRSALAPVYNALAAELTEALNSTPPDAAADICDTGIVLIGGGAEQFGLCAELEKRLGLPVRAAENAAQAAVCGAVQLHDPRRSRAIARAAAR